jgi:hypothetical protein
MPDTAAVALLHKVLSLDFTDMPPMLQQMSEEDQQQMRGRLQLMWQQLLSERVFCALTWFWDVSLGVLARGMTLDAALAALTTALGSRIRVAPLCTFFEAVSALKESAEGTCLAPCVGFGWGFQSLGSGVFGPLSGGDVDIARQQDISNILFFLQRVVQRCSLRRQRRLASRAKREPFRLYGRETE